MKKKSRLSQAINKISERIDKEIVKLTAIVSLTIFFACLICAVHVNDVQENYLNSIRDTILSDAIIKNQEISTLFVSSVMKISDFAIGASYLDVSDKSEVQNYLHEKDTESTSDKFYFVDTDYNLYGSYGLVKTDVNIKAIVSKCDIVFHRYYSSMDITEDGARTGSSNLVVLLPNKNKLYTSSSSFICAVPVVKENAIAGYIISVSTYENLALTYVDSTFTYDRVIVDEDGNVVAMIYEDIIEGVRNEYNFFEYVEKGTNEAAFQKFKKLYSESQSDETVLSYRTTTAGEKIYYIFGPIERSNGWGIIHCVSDDAVNSLALKMLINTVLTFIALTLVMIACSATIIGNIRRSRKEISNLQYLDALTGIMNKYAFCEAAERILKENTHLPYCVVCFDIMNFGIINETYGHERSDEIIKKVAESCKDAFGHNEAYGRLSADVFVALMVDDGTEYEKIKFIEEKAMEAAKSVYINYQIKIKRGVYKVMDYYESVSRMIDKANLARKFVKTELKEMTREYNDALMDDTRKKELIESTMSDALKNGEFVPFFQAKYDMINERVCGAEALVRWIKEDGTLISPGDFIPLFEENGFIVKVDYYMLEQVCKYLRQMLDEGREVFTVSVNQSRYLLNDPDYIKNVRDILLKYKIPVGLLEIEITETVFMRERSRMIDVMHSLKDINVGLSIDDFGSGYSSFNLLKDAPFDVLKIDRAFLSDLGNSSKGKFILEMIIELANGLGMKVVCEGVETVEQAELLKSIGCGVAQGFLYAKPIPMSRFIMDNNPIKADKEQGLSE